MSRRCWDQMNGRRALLGVVVLVLLAACGGGAGPPGADQAAATTTAPAAAVSAPAARATPTTEPCPGGALTVSPIGEWRLIEREPNLTGKAEDNRVVWQATATVANTSTQVVEVSSLVAVNLVRDDASSVVVKTTLRAAATQDRIGAINGPVVDPGVALPVLVVARTRAGWGVSTNAVYVEAEFPARKDCLVSLVGAKPYASAPTNLPPCNTTSVAFACFR